MILSSLLYLHLGRNCRHLKAGHLDKWLVIYEGRQKPIANELINTLCNVCTPMVKCNCSSMKTINRYIYLRACASNIPKRKLELSIIKKMACFTI